MLYLVSVLTITQGPRGMIYGHRAVINSNTNEDAARGEVFKTIAVQGIGIMSMTVTPLPEFSMKPQKKGKANVPAKPSS